MKEEKYTRSYAKMAKRLKKARKEAKLTQKEAAKQFFNGRTQAFIWKIETCERRIDVIELLELCRIYNKPIEYFIK